MCNWKANSLAYALVLVISYESTVQNVHAHSIDAEARIEQQVSKGKQAISQGNYWIAVSAFNTAASYGANHANLFIDLGVAYFYLSQYDEAEDSFTRAYQIQDEKAVAAYFIGKMAQQKGDTQYAYFWYRHVIEMDSNLIITRMAKQRLNQISPYAPKNGSLWQAYIDIAAGFDDNVNFAPTQVSSGIEDNYRYLFTGGQGYLFGNQANGLQLFAYAEAYNYKEIVDNDSTLGHVALAYQFNLWNLFHSLEAIHERSEYANQAYQKIDGIYYSALYYPTIQSFIGYHYYQSRIYSENPLFDYLAGDTAQVRLSYQHWDANTRFHTYVQREINDRADFPISNHIVSHSPTIYTAAIEFEWSITLRWQSLIRALYKKVNYPNALVYSPEVDLFIPGRRQDQQRQFYISLAYDFGKAYRVTVRHQYTENDSNLTQQMYHRKLTEISFNKYF